MDHIDAHRMFEVLNESLGAEKFLEALYKAMSTDEAIENFEFIAKEYDIEL